MVGPLTLRRLSVLLDTALELPVSDRDSWLGQLAGDDAALGPTLRELLARQTSKETSDLLEAPPAFTIAGAPANASDLHIGDTVGPYRLERALGRGGMGEVWLANRIDGGLKRKVALKLPHVTWAPGLAERFSREREILSSLEHPNIARLYDAGVDNQGRPYMALEYVEGQPLDEFCNTHALSIEERLKLLLQVADAMAFAHSRLVVHRDLKPGNMLVTVDGQVRLLDFGIAKLMEGDTTPETVLTQVSGRALTLDYASPEQIRGEPIGTASDVYSLGVVAFELLAGARPYRLKRGSAAELEEVITGDDAPLASEVAEDPALKRELKGDLDAILNKALKKAHVERYTTVGSLAQDWRHYLAGGRVLARPDTLRYRSARFMRRHRIPLASAVLVLGSYVLAIGLGAAAVVIAALAAALGVALWVMRRATSERDHAFALAERNAAVNVFLETLLTRSARAGPLTAEQLLDRSERLIEHEVKGNAEHSAYVLGVLAGCWSQMGNLARAEQLLERALATARDSADETLHATLIGRHAVARARLGKMDEAVATTERILARPGTTYELRSEAHHHLSIFASWAGDSATALRHAKESLRWFRVSRHAPRREEPVLLCDLGWAHLMEGEVDEAERCFAEGMRQFGTLGLSDSTQAVSLLGTWALAQQEMGDLPRSLELFDRALEIAARAAPESPPSAYEVANRAFTLAKMGRYSEAEKDYRECSARMQEQGAALVAFNIRMCLCQLLADQGRAVDCERELRSAEFECTAEVPDNGPGAFARELAQAGLELLRDDPVTALTRYGPLLEDLAPHAGRADALLGRAAAYEAAGRLDAAMTDARDALQMAVRLQGRQRASFRTGLAWLAIARLSGAKGNVEDARREATKALSQLEKTMDSTHPSLSVAGKLANDALDVVTSGTRLSR